MPINAANSLQIISLNLLSTLLLFSPVVATHTIDMILIFHDKDGSAKFFSTQDLLPYLPD